MCASNLVIILLYKTQSVVCTAFLYKEYINEKEVTNLFYKITNMRTAVLMMKTTLGPVRVMVTHT